MPDSLVIPEENSSQNQTEDDEIDDEHTKTIPEEDLKKLGISKDLRLGKVPFHKVKENFF